MAFTLGSCGSGPDIVLYTSVDEPVARPIIAEFERQTGLKVAIQTDTEANKSAGLVTRLEAEKNNPQADVWWGNEAFRTINLADKGVLAAYQSPAAASIPAMYKDPRNRWAATALRVRVIAVTTAPLSATVGGVTSIRQLTGPAFKGKICMARPVAGTTSGHMAALYALWGPSEFESFLKQLKANDLRLLGGNSVVADEIAAGSMWLGLTDNDDVDNARKQNGKIEMIIPDQNEGGIGTLTIPCTVGLIANAPHNEKAKKLVDYLLSREVEKKLLDAKFASYSVFAPPRPRRRARHGGGLRQGGREPRPGYRGVPEGV